MSEGRCSPGAGSNSFWARCSISAWSRTTICAARSPYLLQGLATQAWSCRKYTGSRGNTHFCIWSTSFHLSSVSFHSSSLTSSLPLRSALFPFGALVLRPRRLFFDHFLGPFHNCELVLWVWHWFFLLTRLNISTIITCAQPADIANLHQVPLSNYLVPTGSGLDRRARR